MPSHSANAHGGLAVGPRGVRPHHLTYISLYDFWRGPSQPSRDLLSLYQELGPSRNFSLAVGLEAPVASDPHNFHLRSWILPANHSIVI
jgi:hypothetical protein